MTLTKNYQGQRLLMDAVGWPLILKASAKYVGPFRAGATFQFEGEPLYRPKHFHVHGFTVAIAKNGVVKAVTETDFSVYMQLGPVTMQDSPSLFHSNAALEQSPIEITPQAPFYVRLVPANSFGEKGQELQLSLRGFSLREIL